MAAGEEQPDGASDVYGFYSAETSAFPLNKPSARGTSEGLPKKMGPRVGTVEVGGVFWRDNQQQWLGARSVAKKIPEPQRNGDGLYRDGQSLGVGATGMI